MKKVAYSIAVVVTSLCLTGIYLYGDDGEDKEEEMTESEKLSYKQVKEYEPEVKQLIRLFEPFSLDWPNRPKRQEILKQLQDNKDKYLPILVYLYKEKSDHNALKAMGFIKEGHKYVIKALRKKKPDLSPLAVVEIAHVDRKFLKDYLPALLDLLKEIKKEVKEVEEKKKDDKDRKDGNGKEEKKDDNGKKKDYLLVIASGIIDSVGYIGDASALPILKELEEGIKDPNDHYGIRRSAKEARIKIEIINSADRVDELIAAYENKKSPPTLGSWAEAMLMNEPDKAKVSAYFRRLLEEEKDDPTAFWLRWFGKDEGEIYHKRRGGFEFQLLDHIEELGGTLTDKEKQYLIDARKEGAVNQAKSDLWKVDTLAPKE